MYDELKADHLQAASHPPKSPRRKTTWDKVLVLLVLCVTLTGYFGGLAGHC